MRHRNYVNDVSFMITNYVCTHMDHFAKILIKTKNKIKLFFKQ